MTRRFLDWPYWLPVLRTCRNYLTVLPLFGLSRRT